MGIRVGYIGWKVGTAAGALYNRVRATVNVKTGKNNEDRQAYIFLRKDGGRENH